VQSEELYVYSRSPRYQLGIHFQQTGRMNG
jgi:hypothetical protein